MLFPSNCHELYRFLFAHFFLSSDCLMVHSCGSIEDELMQGLEFCWSLGLNTRRKRQRNDCIMFIHDLIGFLEASNILYFVDDNTKLIIEINDIHVCSCFLSHRIEKNNNEKSSNVTIYFVAAGFSIWFFLFSFFFSARINIWLTCFTQALKCNFLLNSRTAF